MALDQLAVNTPDTGPWWLMRLGKSLTDRWPILTEWRRWYTGDHPLPEGPKKATEAFKDYQKRARTNLCRVPVNAAVNRMTAIGVTDAEGQADTAAWRWWQQNRMDARQKLLYRAATSSAWGYLMVGRHPYLPGTDGDVDRPMMSVEHPREVYVETDTATGERKAAIKLHFDTVRRQWRAVVMLPDGVGGGVVYRYVTEEGKGAPDRAPAWSARTWSVLDAQESVLPVPAIPLPCIPDLGEDPLPLFAPGIDVQDRLNMDVLNRMTSSRYTAFKQKWVTGHKFRKIIDKLTGQEAPEPTFRPGPDNVWASEGENTKFGEFSQIDLSGFLNTHASDIRDFLTLTSTPAYYIAPQLVNIATDTVVALDIMHVSMVRELMLNADETLEEALALCALVAGVERDYTAAEIRWADPRNVNPAVLADAATKKQAIGYPLPILAEDLGESPQRINRIVAGAAGQALLAATVNQPLQPAGVAAADLPTGADADDGS